MKRSKALNTLSSIIVSEIAKITPLSKDWNIEKIQSFSNRILTALENAGMKPPKEKLDPILLTTKHLWEEENK